MLQNEKKLSNLFSKKETIFLCSGIKIYRIYFILNLQNFNENFGDDQFNFFITLA